MKLRVASRASPLALAQTHLFLERLKQKHPHLEIEVISFKTQGDRAVHQPLASLGSVGVFVKELEVALQQNRADIAVHSLKDVPYCQPADLELACFPKRESPRDLLITPEGRGFHQLPEGARIGTSSPRRQMQLQAKREDLQFLDLRGNIDTRLAKLHQGRYDAIVLAEAGVNRLGLNLKAVPLDFDLCVPAPGQGALVIECRKKDDEIKDLLWTLNDASSERQVCLERQIMGKIEAGCNLPFGVYAKEQAGRITLDVFVGTQAEKNHGLQDWKRYKHHLHPASHRKDADALAMDIRQDCIARGIIKELF